MKVRVVATAITGRQASGVVNVAGDHPAMDSEMTPEDGAEWAVWALRHPRVNRVVVDLGTGSWAFERAKETG